MTTTSLRTGNRLHRRSCEASRRSLILLVVRCSSPVMIRRCPTSLELNAEPIFVPQGTRSRTFDGVTLRVDRCEGFKNFAPISRSLVVQPTTGSAVRHLVFSDQCKLSSNQAVAINSSALAKLMSQSGWRYRFCGLGITEITTSPRSSEDASGHHRRLTSQRSRRPGRGP